MAPVSPTHPLVTTDWLAEHLHDPAVRIVDIRGHVAPASDPLPHYYAHHDAYAAAHIPGAVFIDWTRDITDPADPRRARLAPPQRFAETLGGLGIGSEHTVVAYDDAGGLFAARLWWALARYGHTAAAVLDGGWTAWTAELRPVTADAPAWPTAVFTPQPDDAQFRDMAHIAAHLHADSETLVDVRTPGEFTGEASRGPRFGHIPGARNLPRGTLTTPTGHLPTADVLRGRFHALGLGEDAPVTFYCNSGVSASFVLLAYRVAGFTGGRVYDGSWKEWSNSDHPIEGGKADG
jgi:thiosulfate/3-mercaptopyruvate sulfurtransferase